MKYFYIPFLFLFLIAGEVYAQHTFEAIILNEVTGEPLPGASVQVRGTDIGTVASDSGRVSLNGIPQGNQVLIFRFVGFEESSLRVSFPLEDKGVRTILMTPVSGELEEVVITTTRSSRSIESIPTRVEFIGAEELEEKITMQPGNIRMVLSESTGIQTQQTSVSSGNTTIRIQGLDGRYTQLMKDGFPLYGGFSGGLSILQIPPLDLQQVDVIKGSASTLYGGGAIAGLVNLISKQPGDERELLLFGNGTSARGLDLSTYYGERYGKTGLTVYGSRNTSEAYDPAGIGFSAIPEYQRYSINPRFFVYPKEDITIVAGLNAAVENRVGGDMKYLSGNGDAIHSFFERNETDRFSTQLSVENKRGAIHHTFKNSFNFFNRDITQRGYAFGGVQLSSFSEFTLEKNAEHASWIGGVNLWTDDFEETSGPGIARRDFHSTTAGMFVQNLYDINDWLSMETGLRLDYTQVSGKGKMNDLLVLPRVNALLTFSEKVTSRIGGGLGYKTPTLFTEKAEEQVFRNVRALDFDELETERSYGVNADVNYSTSITDNAEISINHLFFYTRLMSPLVFDADSLADDVYYFRNSEGHTDAAGMETNVKLEAGPWKLFAGYTFVNARNHVGTETRALPLTARNRFNGVLMYEVEGSLRVGLEAFYFSPQELSNNMTTPDYWIFGFSAQKKWKHFSVFINFENFTDTRQTRFGSINNGSVTDPEFSELYAPLDGFVFNGGILLTLHAGNE